MRYLALATDYDGTLATDGHVAASMLAALDEVRSSGRKLILVTGRQLPELKQIFPEIEKFDLVVAENGALLYDPHLKKETLLSEPPSASLISLLRGRNVPFAVGRAIIATWEPHGEAVIAAIRQVGLDSHVILNKHSVMVLPAGIDKASGLAAALKLLNISPKNVVAVGDAENDSSMLELCGFGVAVANALPALKAIADLITKKDHGAGVEELIKELLADDLRQYGRGSRTRLSGQDGRSIDQSCQTGF